MVDIGDRLSELQDLPALPTTVTRLIRGLNGEGLNAEELEAIVRTDEAISAAVLRLANSASQGQTTGRFFTLQESIARLGTRTLQKIAISQKCQSVLSQGGAGFGLIRGQMWIGALGGALAAEMIAKESRAADPGICFVAALLRDIGKLAMDQLIGVSEMKRAFANVDPELAQLEIERSAFGFEHAELGGKLADVWGLPEEIGRAIRFHHEPDKEEEGRRGVCDVVHSGDAVAMWMGLGVGHDGLSYPISKRAKEVTGLRRKVVETYMSRVKLALDEIMEESVAG